MTKSMAFLRLRPSPLVETELSRSAVSILDATRSFFVTIGGMLTKSDSTISLELVAGNRAISYIIGVEKEWIELMQQHLYAAYPLAEVEILKTWSLFDIQGEIAGASIKVEPIDGGLFVEPHATNDTMQAILEMLSSVPKQARVSVQLLLRTTEPKKPLLAGVTKDILHDLGYGLKSLVLGADGHSENHPKSEPETSKQSIFRATINILALAETMDQAKDIVHKAAVVYHQFAVAGETRLSYETPKHMKPWLERVVLRQGDASSQFLLTSEEAASLYHPPFHVRSFPQLDAPSSINLPPPSMTHKSGLFLGMSSYRGFTKPVYIHSDDRFRHAYLIGQTGTGKSTLFQSAMLQDMLAGSGCCFIDPHGEAIDWLLPRIPQSRLQDVVLFDASDSKNILGLNLLEWKTPEERDLLIQELIYLFYKLFDPQRTGIIGPQFEHWLRCAALTITEPNIRGTIVDIPRLFTDNKFQKIVLRHTEHGAVKDFWQNQMAQTSGFHKSEMLNYFTSKFGSFLGNTTMYQILSQRYSAFNIKTLMDKRKILLVNLSKGKLGSLNAQLLGTLFMTKIQMAALSRADIPPEDRVPFFVYVDEFQNLATDSFTTMLSEIRKYRVALHLTHQYVDQLPETVRQAVVGNVGTIMAFRLGHRDAEWLAPHFMPLSEEDLTAIRPYHYHIRTLTDGTRTTPFTIQSVPLTTSPQDLVERAIRLRMQQFAISYRQAIDRQTKSTRSASL